MAHNHLADVIVNLNFTFAKLCLKLSCGNLSLSEFLNSVGDIILEVIDGLYLWFDLACLSKPAAVVTRPKICSGHFRSINLGPFLANIKALIKVSHSIKAYSLKSFVIDIKRIFFQELVAFRCYWQTHIL